jgi:carbon monoxide dehydrogenase subunit G
MRELNLYIEINAPVEKVFNYVSDTPKLSEIWPNLVSVRNWQRGEDGLASFDYSYRMAGFNFAGKNRDLVFEKNKRIVTQSEGGIQSTISWGFEPEGEITRVNVSATYSAEIPLVGKVIENRLYAINEIEIEALLKNLKAKMEHS